MKKILSFLTIQMLFFSSFAQVRPDINSFTSAQQTQLATLMQQYITPQVIEDHCNYDPMGMGMPHIHSEFDFLPFHRMYIERMEDFLIRQGFPQFVPLPYWDPSGTVPLPLRVIDADCGSATCNNGNGACSFSINWTPNRVLPANLKLPIIAGANNDLCDWNMYNPAPPITMSNNEGSGNSISARIESPYHDGTHIAMQGVMSNFRSPSLPIF